jgi:DNA-damage-inducible protein J
MPPLEIMSNSQAYDSRFREKVRQALADPRPDLDDSEVDAHFAKRRAAALRKASGCKR